MAYPSDSSAERLLYDVLLATSCKSVAKVSGNCTVGLVGAVCLMLSMFKPQRLSPRRGSNFNSNLLFYYDKCSDPLAVQARQVETHINDLRVGSTILYLG